VHSLVEGKYHLGKWKTFIAKRLIRLEPPYLVVLFLTFAYLIIRSIVKGPDKDTPDFSQLLLHIGYLIPFTKEKWLSIVFWSLAVEFQFYFLISFAYPLLLKYATVRWAIFVTFWALHFIFPSIEFFYWSLVFVPGMQLAFFNHDVISKTEFLLSFITLPLLIYLNYDIYVFAFSFATFLLIFFNRDFKSSLLNFFGNISYSLYLVHMLAIVPLRNIGLHYFTSDAGRVGMFLAMIMLVILSAYLLYRYVEKPSKEYAGSIRYNDRLVE
jgi:peptidoglycan/LPS O-acetylase OafA/YrhL